VKAVILAGGLGTRLSEETQSIPKPMVKIGDWPILWHIMKIYSHYGVNEFVICLGYKGYVIKEFFANYLLHVSDIELDLRSGKYKIRNHDAEPRSIHLIETGPETMTGGRLKRVAGVLNGTFCLTYGDGVADIDIAKSIAFHREHGKRATVTAVRPSGRFGVLHMDDDHVVGFSEKTDAADGYINGGFFVLEPSVLDYIAGDATSWEGEPLERLAREGQLAAFRHDGFWQPMDTLRDKNQLERLWAGNKAPWKIW
jgi:glucose-1-phosphate cytidylyltransferase